MDEQAVVRNWINRFVIGLNLCPFAKPVSDAKGIRIAVSHSQDNRELAEDFLRELDLLQGSSENDTATTLLVFTRALSDFNDFLDFLAQAHEWLEQVGLGGHIQLASFHPHYQFDGVPGEAPENYSNRSPYPIVHLLRENMMTRLLDRFPDPDEIPRRNVQTLNEMGPQRLADSWSALFYPAD